jgi:hypothetical protein
MSTSKITRFPFIALARGIRRGSGLQKKMISRPRHSLMIAPHNDEEAANKLDQRKVLGR